jgi:hypothetical protein
VSRTQTLLTKICQVCNEIHDIKLDAQSYQENNKYVYSVNRRNTRGVHIINKINIQKQKENDIINNHKAGTEDIHEREHRDCNYSSDKSPTCQMDAGSNTYSHDGCGEHPTQMLSCLTPEKPKISHELSPDLSELTVTLVESLPSFPVLFQSSSLSDPSTCSSFESPDSEVMSSRGSMILDSCSDSVLVGKPGDPVDPGDLGKGVLQ